MCEPDGNLWSVVGSSDGFTICAAKTPSGYLAWRVLIEAQDGTAESDRTFDTGHQLIAACLEDLQQETPRVVDAFKQVLDYFPGLKETWRDHYSRLAKLLGGR